MFESIMNFFKKMTKKEEQTLKSKDAAKERLHLVLMQDRANVSADFLDLMKQEIIEVIKKYIDIDEGAMDVRLTNKENGDGSNGAPALYANIPIINIKDQVRQTAQVEKNSQTKQENKKKNNKKHNEKKQIVKVTNSEKKEYKKQEVKKQKNNQSENTQKEKNKEQDKKIEVKQQDNKIDETKDNTKEEN